MPPSITPQPDRDNAGRRDRSARAPWAAVRWAWQVVDEFGEDRPDGTVGLRWSQAELATLSGFPRNDGRISRYLSQLRDVVVCKRGEVILSRARLIELEQSMVLRPMSKRATSRAGEHLAATLSAPTADGTTGRTTRPADSQPGPADSARPAGHTAGSGAQRHLRALRSDTPDSDSAGAGDVGEVPELRRRVALLEELTGVNERIVADLVHRAELYLELGMTSDHAGRRADPRADLRDDSPIRASCADSAQRRADQGDQDEIREDKKTSTSLTSSPLPARTLNERAEPDLTERAEPSQRADNDWVHDDLDELCSDLHKGCEAHGLPGPSNRTGLLAALQPYTADQIREASRRVARNLGHRQVRSPFGLLVAVAGPDHPEHRSYFPPARTTPPPPQPVQRIVEDQEASDAITAMVAAGDTRALEDLDGLIAVRYGKRPRSLELSRADPDVWHQLRCTAWRASTNPSPPPEETP